MELIRQYLVTVIIAVIISALSVQILGQNSPYTPIIKLITGIFLTIAMFTPITKIKINEIYSYYTQFETASTPYIAEGIAWGNDQTSAYIKEHAESYVLDKATSLGLSIDADIELSDTQPSIPIAIKLRGKANPYQKQRLQRCIEEDLGIKMEAQSWNS